MNDAEVSDLIKRCLGADPEAWAKLDAIIDEIAGQIARRRFSDRMNRDEVLQQTKVRIFRFLPQYRGDSCATFEAYIRKIAVNVCNRVIKVNRRNATLSIELLPESESERSDRWHPAAGLDREDQKEILEAAIKTLPAQLQVVLLLREIQGASYREIARACKIPLGTVSSQLSNARNTLRDKLHKYRSQLGFPPDHE